MKISTALRQVCLIVFVGGFLALCWHGVRGYVAYSQPVPDGRLEDGVASLCSDVAGKAAQKGFRGPILELEAIDGDAGQKLAAGLVSLVNAELGRHFESMVAGERLRRKATTRVNALLAEHAWIDKSPEIRRTAPEFFPVLDFDWVRTGERFRLSLRVVRCSATASFVEATREIDLPEFVEDRRRQQRDAAGDMATSGVLLLAWLISFALCRRAFLEPHQP